MYSQNQQHINHNRISPTIYIFAFARPLPIYLTLCHPACAHQHASFGCVCVCACTRCAHLCLHTRTTRHTTQWIHTRPSRTAEPPTTTIYIGRAHRNHHHTTLVRRRAHTHAHQTVAAVHVHKKNTRISPRTYERGEHKTVLRVYTRANRAFTHRHTSRTLCSARRAAPGFVTAPHRSAADADCRAQRANAQRTTITQRTSSSSSSSSRQFHFDHGRIRTSTTFGRSPPPPPTTTKPLPRDTRRRPRPPCVLIFVFSVCVRALDFCVRMCVCVFATAVE